MGQYSKVEVDGHLMIATINRPEVYNACHPMANQELVEAFDEFHSNPDLWVAIITGAGEAFSAGGNVKNMKGRTAVPIHDVQRNYRIGVQQIPLAFDDARERARVGSARGARGSGLRRVASATLNGCTTKARAVVQFRPDTGDLAVNSWRVADQTQCT